MKTKHLRDLPLLLVHAKIEGRVNCLGTADDHAIGLSENIEV